MKSVLRIEGLRKEFGGLVAVKEVSFEIGEGEFVGLIGPNGCGKSTTFNCISGLLEQTEGTIEMFGEDVSKLRPDQIQNLGMTRTFQHTRLWRQMTVIENLMVPPRGQFGASLSERIRALLVPNSNPKEAERLEKAYAVYFHLENLTFLIILHQIPPRFHRERPQDSMVETLP